MAVNSGNLIVGKWHVFAVADSDGHLTVELRHEDGSKINEVNEDFLDPDEMLTIRFTTEAIETEYTEANQ